MITTKYGINKTTVVVAVIIGLSLLGFSYINYLTKTKIEDNKIAVKKETETLSKEKTFEFNQSCLDKKNKMQEEYDNRIIPNWRYGKIDEIFYSPVENSCMYTVLQVIDKQGGEDGKQYANEILIYKYGLDNVWSRYPNKFDEYVYDKGTMLFEQMEADKEVRKLKGEDW